MVKVLDNGIVICDFELKLRYSQFLPGSGRIDTAKWMHYLDAN